jgi:uncharacterized protein (DUF488 family)
MSPREECRLGKGNRIGVVMPKLFTIGYEGIDVEDFVARLVSERIERVVDVRELPLSRRRGFSKSRLAKALQEAGIKYEHVRALGNPKVLREQFKAGDQRPYRAHLHNGSRDALLELAETIGDAETCLLCVEQSHVDCHRSVIAGALAERLPRLAIVHL